MIKFAKKDLGGLTPYDAGRSDWVNGVHDNPWMPHSWFGKQWEAGQDYEAFDFIILRQEQRA